MQRASEHLHERGSRNGPNNVKARSRVQRFALLIRVFGARRFSTPGSSPTPWSITSSVAISLESPRYDGCSSHDDEALVTTRAPARAETSSPFLHDTGRARRGIHRPDPISALP